MFGEGEIQRRREPEAAFEIGEARSPRRVEPEGDKLVRLRIGKRLEQDTVDDAEDSGVGADADGERQQDCDGESGRLAKAAKSELEIGEKRFKCAPLPLFAAALLNESDVAEFATGGLLGLFAGNAFGLEFVGALLDVLLNGDVDVG